MVRKTLLCGTTALAMSLMASKTSAQSQEDAGANAAPPSGPVTAFYGTINPFFGDISPFFGDISPFWGDINPFWGDINPFWGDINPFWGDINPFWGDINPFYGTINPFWGQIQPFWGDLVPFWGDINPFWGNLQPFSEATSEQYAELQSQLMDFYGRSKAMWEDRVKAVTGKDFDKGFADKLFAKYGFDIDDPASLSGVTAEQRARFFMDWYDGLMEFSGFDHVDHWMATVNWTPSLTQDQGKGADAVVGLLDARIAGDADLQNNIEYAGGYMTFSNDHGAAVASLIFADHDGRGVMGIAPNAHVMLYNPFDSTGTASWQDVRTGLISLANRNVDVVNLSLGVPGWTLNQGLTDILSDASLYDKFKDIAFVAAAGNSGTTQTADVNWSSWVPRDNLIIVGSVGIDETISSFSNRPGEACIKTYGWCQEADKLKYHFMVAPGELLLVSDNHGGVTRVSGTSFAAPLVSGALTLLYDRWPWLQDKPEVSTQILFETAKDLGAPGVDSVYGWGLLDVEASQSPLDFNNLVIYQGGNYQISSRQLKQMAMSATTRGSWEASGAYLTAFESVGSTYRDFLIPLSSMLNGQSSSKLGRVERFQRHIYGRLIDWANGTTSLTQTQEQTTALFDDWTMSFSGGEADPYSDSYDPELPFQMTYNVANPKTGFGLHFGYGEGAAEVFDQPGFAFGSDYDSASGGVNPILGFAMGDLFAGASYDLSEDTTVTLGYTQFTASTEANPMTGGALQPMVGMDPYAASALVLDVKYFANDWLTLNANYTQLEEDTGLLGVQGMGALSLAGGATTDAVTLGAGIDLDEGLMLSLSGTVAKTRTGNFSDSALAVAGGGITSTAFAVGLQQNGVFEKTDAVRFSLLQPLHIESGALSYTSMQVIDRDTGETGLVTDSWAIGSGERQIAAEVLYATPLFDGQGELGLTARVNLTPSTDGEDEGVTVGSRFAVRF